MAENELVAADKRKNRREIPVSISDKKDAQWMLIVLQ